MEEEKGYVLIRHFIRGHLVHSRSQKRADQRVLVLTLKFLSLKKLVFPPLKKSSQIFFFSMQPFKYFQKNFKLIFCP